MRDFFKAEDFYLIDFDDIAKWCADQANAKLEKMLAEAPLLYSRPNFGNNCEVWARVWENGQEDIRRCARLVDIKPIPAAPAYGCTGDEA